MAKSKAKSTVPNYSKGNGVYTKKVAQLINGKYDKKGARTIRKGMMITNAYAEEQNANDNGTFYTLDEKATKAYEKEVKEAKTKTSK